MQKARIRPIQGSLLRGFDLKGARLKGEAVDRADLVKVMFAGMQFELSPRPNSLTSAMGLTLTALRQLYQSNGSAISKKGRHRSTPATFVLQDTDVCCSVTSAESEADGCIVVVYSKAGRTMAITLPNRATWRHRGLSWLFLPSTCCALQADNPEPWCGSKCECRAQRH